MRAWISETPVTVDDVLAAVGTDADGAIALFLGTVRDHNDGRPVRGMRYEGYRPMAERVLRDIAAEASVRAGSDRVAVVHRLGELVLGDVSVAIAVSSPHRAESFDACRFIIEEIKKRLPVWKHEHYTDGDTAWVAGTAPPAGSPEPPPRIQRLAGDAPARVEAGKGSSS